VFHGTYGEIVLNELSPYLELKKYGEEVQKISFCGSKEEAGFSHGGGDYMMIKELYHTLTSEQKCTTALDASIESHLMCIAAEESRLDNGKRIYVHAK
ncbi:MAG: hypothetical protein IJB97_07180, partial [Clostridia bacterium]|nr:hypothetical protein [Clostridia bacterium]